MNTFTPISRLIKATFLFFILCMLSRDAAAQHYENRFQPVYYGFKAGIGSQFYKISSNISQIHNLNVLDEGGYAGLVIGNNSLKLSTQVGFYYSADRVPYTIDLVHSSADLNFYPLAFFSKRNYALQPFISGGMGVSRAMFYGHYLQLESDVRSKIGTDPFLGKVRTTVARVSFGFEYRVPSCDFVHLFVDAQFENGLKRRADASFQKTTVADAGAITIGVCFGSMKLLDIDGSR